MRPTIKASPAKPKAPVKAPAPMERVLEACAELSSFKGGLEALRQRIAESAGDIFHAVVSGIMVRDGETFYSAAVCPGAGDPISAEALMEHSRSYAAHAIEQNQQLGFKFSYRFTQTEAVYHGVAHPILTTGASAVLLMVRKSAFTPAEISALGVMGNIGRLALDNSELAGLYAGQKQKLDQLLEISADLGSSRLESFFPAFVVRAAEFLGASRAFVALVDQGECRLRWGASKGSATRLDIDISALSKRVLDSRNPHLCEDINQLSSIEKAQLRRWESELKQYLGIPLLTSDGRQLGILGFLDKRDKTPFSPDDVRRARVLGAEITVALEATHNLQLSDQHRKRTEDLMEMALDLGSALRLPDFVKNFTERVASMIGARSAILSLAQGNKVESVGFCGPRPERELQRKLNAAFSEYAERHPDVKITGSGVQALGPDLIAACGWQNLTLVRLEGTENDLLGILALADISRELMPGDLNLLQALIVHASVALENSRLFTRITQSSRQWAEIFDSISDFIVVHDEHFEVMRVNRSLSEFIGVRPAELIGLSMRALVSIASDSPQPCPFCRAENESDEYLHPVLERTYLVSSSRIHGALDEGLQTVHVLKDITDRREAEQRYRELFDNVQEGVFFASPEGHFIEVNDALVRMLGYQTREEVLK
ncbi:MAG: PAS domain S-box protein, partial [Candidatus Angelobacter sp.]